MKSSYDSKSISKIEFFPIFYNLVNTYLNDHRIVSKCIVLFFCVNIFCFTGIKNQTIMDHFHTYPLYLTNDSRENFLDYNYDDVNTNISILTQLKQIQKQAGRSVTTTAKPFKDCSSLFDNCLCSFNRDIQRNFLYCNDQMIKKIPDFKAAYNSFNRNTKGKKTELNLIFSKIDFSGSSIKYIRKEDLKYLQFDLYNQKSVNILSNNSSQISASSSQNTFDTYLEELKKSIIPMFHLDFDNIIDIEDSAFDEFINKSIELTFKLAIQSDKLLNTNEMLLKIRFSNSKFNFSPSRKPFKGLKAQEVHFNNLSNEYLTNSIFDQSVIADLFIENTPSFIGFLDMSNNLPSGKLLNRFIVTRSYKIDSLCSHSLPSFVDQENFHEIIIKKCSSLSSIKEFTFYRYRHLKTLILSSNNLNKIDKQSFRYLNQLELLDLSSNPIISLDDETFKDLSSLKRLYLESTQIKQINENTFTGMTSLNELSLAKSAELSEIHGKAFHDQTKTLKELNLKDTQIRLLDAFRQDGIIPPYLHELKESYNTRKRDVWIENLDLELLNIDSNAINEEFSFKNFHTNTSSQNLVMCKFLRYVSSNTLVNLQRNQTCNCLIYFIYRNKEFPLYTRWEYKAPFCYRAQIKVLENGTKSFENIKQREIECNLDSLSSLCFPPPTTTTTSTTTTTKAPITTIKRTTRTRPTKPKELNNPTPQMSANNKGAKFPRLDLAKLVKVVMTIIGISALSILLTIVGLRLSQRLNKRRKVLKMQNMRQRTSSNTSSTQANLMNNPMTSSKAKLNRVVMPPTVMPNFSKNLSSSKKSIDKSTAINQLISQTSATQFTNIARLGQRSNQNESNVSLLATRNNLNDVNFNISNAKNASFSIDSVINE